MSAHPEAKLRALFDAARDVPPDDRATFLSAECGDDPELRRRVESLLACDVRPTTFLDSPIVTPEARAVLDDADAGWQHRLPERLGRYRVVREIGGGSMGTVFEAELESPHRAVAVKVLRPGVSTAAMLRRFQFEASALKRLDHPCVAKFYDSGTTDTGCGPQPFFAMELVRGRPVTEVSSEKLRTVRQRLELLAKVCDAVHHAHTKGIIHRDLKPGNILVDEAGEPRVLDFGVARAVHGDLGAQTDHTATGQLIGTLRYMSPEQAQGDPADVDTRCDIYSLGVIGFELLSGRPPRELDGRPIPEAIRALIESDPPRLGTLDRALRGDVETIIAKALEKEKERRYASASDMAADIRRFLADEPIMARPPSVLYQLSKYARRNKGWFSGAVAALVILILGLAGTGYGFLTAERQRREAEIRKHEAEQQRAIAERRLADAEAARDESEAVTGLLARMLESVDPEQLGRDVLIRDVLAEASERIGEELTERPLVEARMRHTLGTSYLSLGDYAAAQEHLTRALELRREELGARHPDTLRSAVRVAMLYIALGRYAEAESLQRTTLELQRSVLGERHEETLKSLNMLAVTTFTQGRPAEAEPLYDEVLEIQRATLGPEHPESLDTLHNLALLYINTGRHQEAEAALRAVHEVEQRVLGQDHPDTLDTLDTLAHLAQQMGRLEEAEALFNDGIERLQRVRGAEHPHVLAAMSSLAQLYTDWGRLEEADVRNAEVLAIQRRTLGDEHPQTLGSLNRQALLRQAQGRFEEAEVLHLQVIEAQERVLGKDHPGQLLSVNSLANLYTEQGRYGEAEKLHLKALAIQERKLGREHPDTLASMHNLACLRILQGRFEEAEPLCRETLEIRRRLLGVDHPDTQSSMNTLTVLYEKQGRYAEAESMYRETLAVQSRLFGETHEQVLVSMNNLGDLYNTLGRYQEAEELLGNLVDRTRRALPEGHWFLGAFLTKYGASLTGLQEYDRAESTLLEAHEILLATFGADHHRTADAVTALVNLYDAAGRPDEADAWRARPNLAAESLPPSP